jgi:hypothetical protein
LAAGNLLLMFMSMGWDDVSELLSLTGLLFILHVIYESVEPRWNDIERGKLKNSEENLSQCHFPYHKYNMDWPGCEPGSQR